MVHFVFPLEERFFGEEFAEYTAYAPHVYLWAVFLSAEEELWGAVPKSHDQLSKFWWRVTVISGHAKVGDFHLPSIVHKEVGGLQIAMQYPVAVQVFHCGCELKEEGFDLRGEERFRHIFLQGLEVVLEEVHDEEDAGLEDQLAGLGLGGDGEKGPYSLMLSPMTTSRRFTILTCRDSIKVWISRRPVTGNPSLELSIFNFFKATISPVAVSFALDTHP